MLTKFLCNNRRPQQKHHSHQHQRQRQQQLAFRPIVNLKDGCFGVYLAKICETNNGIFTSVDVDEKIIK